MFYEKQAEHIINRLNVHATASYLKTSQRNLTEDVILGIHAKFRSKRDSVVLMGWVQDGCRGDLYNPNLSKSIHAVKTLR
jgi:hypothetical protein